jgi:hypothetical protein
MELLQLPACPAGGGVRVGFAFLIITGPVISRHGENRPLLPNRISLQVGQEKFVGDKAGTIVSAANAPIVKMAPTTAATDPHRPENHSLMESLP